MHSDLKKRKSLTLAAGTFNLNLITIAGRSPAFEYASYKIIFNYLVLPVKRAVAHILIKPLAVFPLGIQPTVDHAASPEAKYPCQKRNT